jgi:hypothetical protein
MLSDPVFQLSCMGQDADEVSPLVFGLCGLRSQCILCLQVLLLLVHPTGEVQQAEHQ